MSRHVATALTAVLVTTILLTGAATGSASAPGQQPPVNVTPPSISGAAVVGSTLTASTGTWSGKRLKYAYQWLRCDSSGASCAAIGGAVASSYTLSSALVGATLRVLVTATNRNGSAAATSAATPPVASAPTAPSPPAPPPAAPAPMSPSVTSPPTISGTAQQGQTLSALTGSWSGTTPITYTYQWQRCDSGGASCAPVAGATASNYAVVSADVGSTMRVSVTASNSVGSASASSPATAVVSAPSATSPPSSTISGLGVLRFSNSIETVTNLDKYAGVVCSYYDLCGTIMDAQPGQGLFYTNAVVVNVTGDNGVPYKTALANNWLLRDSSGNVMYFRNGTAALGDVGNAGYQQAFAQNVAARLARFPDMAGIFVDNVSICTTEFTSTLPQRYPTRSSWEQAQKSFHTYVNGLLRSRGYYVMGNAGAICPGDARSNDASLTRYWWNLLVDANGKSLFNGLMYEHWMFPSGRTLGRLNYTDAWYNFWSNYAGLQTAARSLGADFDGEDSDLSAAAARYSRATFLLDYDCGRSAWMWSANPDPWSTIPQQDIGCPTGPKYEIAPSVWRRDFGNGYVIVNPTNAASNGIPSGDAIIYQKS